MRFTSSQTSFKSGRLSPKLFNRVDTAQYRDGASQLVGCRPMLEGGIDRIKGYRYFDQTVFEALGNSESKMFSFLIRGKTLVAVVKRYTTVTTNKVTLTFFRYPYYVNSPITEFQIVQEGATAYDVKEFDFAVVDNTLFITHFSGTMCPRVVTFNDAVDTASLFVMYAAFASTVDIPVDANYGTGGVTPTYNAYQKFVVTNPNFYPMSDMSPTGHGLTIGAYTAGKVDITCATADAATVAIIQKSSVLYLEGIGKKNFGDGNLAAVIASGFYVRDTSAALVTNGAKYIPALVWDGPKDIFNFLGTTTTDVWSHNLWRENNWPRTVTSHEGRIVFGGTPDKPLTFFGSQVAKTNKFCQYKYPSSGSPYLLYPPPSGSTLPTDPFTFTVATKADSQINFIRSAGNLIIGTDRQEYIASGGDTLLSALSVNLKPQTSQGSVPVTTASNGNAVYYLSKDGKQLFKFKYNEANGSFVSQELSVLFSDLLENDKIVQIEWVPHTASLMIVTEGRNLYGIVDNAQTDTTAFYDTGMGGVVSVCFVAARESQDQHIGDHVLVGTTIGLTIWDQVYYEKGMNSGVVEGQTSENLHLMLDRAIIFDRESGGTMRHWGSTFTPTPDDTIPLPSWVYEFRQVYVLDPQTGYFIITPQITPSNVDGDGYYQVTDPLLTAAEYVLVGIAPRIMEGATMPVEAGQQWGTSQMGVKNIDTIGTRFYRSYSVEISSGEGTWEEVVVADTEGKAVSGRKEVKFSASPKYDQIIYFRNTKPEPLTIVGLNMRGVSNDG